MKVMQKVNNFSGPSTTYEIIRKQLSVEHFVLILIILIFKTIPGLKGFGIL